MVYMLHRLKQTNAKHAAAGGGENVSRERGKHVSDMMVKGGDEDIRRAHVHVRGSFELEETRDIRGRRPYRIRRVCVSTTRYVSGRNVFRFRASTSSTLTNVPTGNSMLCAHALTYGVYVL